MKKRVFIAVNLPEDTKEKIGELIVQLKKINPQPEIRYVKSKIIHLTLHFLGELEEKQINNVKSVLNNIANKYSETKLITGQIGAFRNFKNPRVIFLSSQKKSGDKLINLQRELGWELQKIGIKIDKWPWQVHLTLARVTDSTEFKTEQVRLPNLEIPIKSIELMESQLNPYGSEYTILESYTLKS